MEIGDWVEASVVWMLIACPGEGPFANRQLPLSAGSSDGARPDIGHLGSMLPGPVMHRGALPTESMVSPGGCDGRRGRRNQVNSRPLGRVVEEAFLNARRLVKHGRDRGLGHEPWSRHWFEWSGSWSR